MESFEYKIRVPAELSFEQLQNGREQGGRFVLYLYIFPLPLFRAVRVTSPAYYLAPGEAANKYAFRYNLLTGIIGWWGLPFGPAATVGAIRSNRKGIDVSKDVFDNLTQEDFTRRRVLIQKISQVFNHPDKDSVKAIKKALAQIGSTHGPLKRNPVIAVHIDLKDAPFCIGLAQEDLALADSILVELKKQFFANVQFEFISLESTDELTLKLVEQGLELKLD